MEKIADSLICRQAFNAQKLVDAYPPTLKHKHKKTVYEIACPSGCTHNGQLVFSRWRAMPLPKTFSAADACTAIEERSGYFDYNPLASDQTGVEWYPNFAHSDLFCAYGGPLFAQDEMQVAEHPALGSLREALLAEDINLLTVEAGRPTPVAIRGVERRCAIATDPNAEQRRPFGLYGNHFARAKPETIRLATTPLNPPTVTNIIAMEAPPGGYGAYTASEIEYILVTAFTAFAAAKFESGEQIEGESTVTMHAGFWGCGAYGGNRVLMALLQFLAARLAKLDRFIFHTGTVGGDRDLKTAQTLLDRDLIPAGSTVELSALIQQIEAMDFRWGVSDGN